jgi:hypothetical protein
MHFDEPLDSVAATAVLAACIDKMIWLFAAD